MPFAASGDNGSSSGESISHFAGVRMRVTGAGSLDMKFVSQDEEMEQDLIPFTMAAATKIQPFRLANFQQQRAMFEFSTNAIDEQFSIARIVLFAKYLWNEYPSVING